MSFQERVLRSVSGKEAERIPNQLAILGASRELVDEARSKSDEARERVFLKFIEGKHGFPLDWAGGLNEVLEELTPLLTAAERNALPKKRDFPTDGPAVIAVVRKALSFGERRLVQTQSLGDFSVVILVPSEKEQEFLECVGPWVISDDPSILESLAAKPADYAIRLPVAFRRWLARVPPKTRYTGELLIEKVLPRFVAAGFKPVTTRYGVRSDRVETTAIRLERKIGDIGDHIQIRFYEGGNSPRFEVDCGRASLIGKWEYEHCAMLVGRGKRQYWYSWGPGWLYPVVLWPNRMSRRTVRVVASKIDQILHFLDTGERGRNIGLKLLKK